MGLTVSGMDSNTVSTLFSSLKNSSSSSNSVLNSNILSDYYSIQNGSYTKLMKAYYNTDEGKASIKSGANSNATAIKGEVDSLKESIEKLQNDDLYKTSEVTNEDGTKETKYDVDSIYSAVKNYVSDYNDLISSAKNNDTTGILTAVNSIVGYSKVDSSSLSKIGISIKSDNTLSIDEDKFKKADMKDVKSVFGSRGSYAYQVSASATMAGYYAKAALSTGYKSSGNYNISNNSSYTSYV